MSDDGSGLAWGISLTLVAALVLGGAFTLMLWGCPRYEVYQQEYEGRAQLAKANQNREILVSQARAEKEAAELRSQAIAIVGKAAKEYPEYRQQEFIGAFADALRHGQISQIMYVPTEANIPITEAGRMVEHKK